MANDLDSYFSGIKSPQSLLELSRQSKGWFKTTVAQLRKKPIARGRLPMGDSKNNTSRMMIGKLYIFEYDAKYKQVLPIWDRFPLALPFSTDGKTFYALNLHYLPHKQRAWLLYQLDKIYALGTTSEDDSTVQKNKSVSSGVLTKAKEFFNKIKSKLSGGKDVQKKMKLSWQLISSISKVNSESAVHRYLPDHIKSPLRVIPPEDYAKVILLPFEVWVRKK